MNSSERSDVEPRAAATLVILRDGAEGPEVLLTVRPETLRFMGGATVFPGGAIAEGDASPRWEGCSRLDRAGAAAALKEPEEAALAPYICALREAFEEVGFLLADGGSDLPRAASSDPGAFLELCNERGIVLRTDLLIPAGRWVTPLGSPIRFDAHFFIVRAPDGWEPSPDPAEVASAFWLDPQEALKRLEAGEMMMVPPTIEMLQRLTLDPDVASIIGSMDTPDADSDREAPDRFSAFVKRIVAPNPGLMTGPGTNTYIVGAGPTCVIDPAVDDEAYIEDVLAAAPDLAAILITHRHPDHVGGIAAIVERTGVPVRAWSEEQAGGIDVVPIADDEVLEFGGARLRAMFTPGHAPDHLCFYLEGGASLFAGDNVLGYGTAVISPPEGHMKTYLESLQRMKAFHISRIYPGHFPPLDGGDEVLNRYLSHREERNAAILKAISEEERTLEEIVAEVYTDTPEELHPIAVHQVEAHLEMLRDEGRVSTSGNRWFGGGVDYSEGNK